MKRGGTKPVAASDYATASTMVISTRSGKRRCASGALNVAVGFTCEQRECGLRVCGLSCRASREGDLSCGQDDAVSDRREDRNRDVWGSHAAPAGGARAIGRGTARRGEPQMGHTETSLPVSLRRCSRQVFFRRRAGRCPSTSRAFWSRLREA